jgi:hypothetical protein
LEPILRGAAEVAVPVVVLGEYRYRVRQSRDRQKYERWLDIFGATSGHGYAPCSW